jgi:hypothetical protein
MPFQVALALCLGRERLLGSSSEFGAYLALLPKSFDVPLFWGHAEMRALSLADPAVFSKVLLCVG